MLVLSRKKNETIIIDDRIAVTLVEIRSGEKCRVGVDAPADMSVHRLEVWQEINGKAWPDAIPKREGGGRA